jgi:hypothetical protein
MPKQFWAEAISTASYLINRSPSAALEKKTPMGVWTSVKHSYKSLKVFGSLAYSHVKQDKLDPRVEKYIFLGHPDGCEGVPAMET